MNENDNHVSMICSNKECYFNKHPFPMFEGNDRKCMICNSDLIIVNEQHWLSKIVEDKNLWFKDSIDEWPCLIAFEFSRLKALCVNKNSYGVLWCLKDNFEAIIKFETLLAYAWAAVNMDSSFEEETIAKITTPNLSLGAWLQLAKIIVSNLKDRDIGLPKNILLDVIVDYYNTYDIVNWRNEKFGHGVMGFEDDESYKNDISIKIFRLCELLKKIDYSLRRIKLYVNHNIDRVYLNGAAIARTLSAEEEIYADIESEYEESFIISPFINICKNDDGGFGVYFFDSQKRPSISIFQEYNEGRRIKRRDTYFERLSACLNKKGLSLDSIADNPNKSEEEYRILDAPFVVDAYVPQSHLLTWVKNSVEKHSKGIFLLKMERGTGKSVFTEKLNRLFKDPLVFDEKCDVRTYHLSRMQTGGAGDMITYLSWLWDHDYNGYRYMGIKQWNEKIEIAPSQIMVRYLESVLESRIACSRSDKIMMVFDGLDEIVDDKIWSYFPKTEELPEGVYLLLSSRNPETEKLDEKISNNIKSIVPNEELSVHKECDDNIAFLRQYITNTNLSGMSVVKKDLLIEKSSFRILELSLLCRMLENGMSMETIGDSKDLMERYLALLQKRYGVKEFNKIKELLVIIAALGTKEPLSLNSIAQISMDNNVTIGLIGMIYDISPLLDIEHGENGNCYRISNEDVEKQIIKSITDSYDIIRNIIEFALAAMKEDYIPEKNSGESIVCAHITELSLMVPEGTRVMGDDRYDVLLNFCNKYKSQTLIYSSHMVYNCHKQLYYLCSIDFGYSHINTIRAKVELSSSLGQIGRRKEAIENSRETLKKYVNILGEMNTETVDFEYELAERIGITIDKQNNVEPIALFWDVFKKRRKIYGINHKKTLEALSSVARGYSLQRDYRHAIKLENKIYRIRRRALGEGHKETLLTLWSIADNYENMGLYEKALKIYKYIYDNKRKRLGKENDSSMRTLYDIAELLLKTKNKVEAMKAYDNIYTSLSSLQELNEEELILYNNLAISYYRQGDENKTIYIMESLKNIYEKMINSKDFSVRAAEKYTRTLFYFKRNKEAIKWEKRILENTVRNKGINHYESVYLQNNYSIWLDKCGEYDKAQIELKKTYEMYKELYGETSIHALTLLHKIATMMCKIGNYQDAYSIENDVCDKIYKTGSGDELLLIQSQCTLGVCLYELGRTNEALNILAKIFENFRELYKANLPDILVEWNKISEILKKLGITNEEFKKISKTDYRTFYSVSRC